jgi:hypothetical protein
VHFWRSVFVYPPLIVGERTLRGLQAHQVPNPVTADANAVAPQLTDHLAIAVIRAS